MTFETTGTWSGNLTLDSGDVIPVTTSDITSLLYALLRGMVDGGSSSSVTKADLEAVATEIKDAIGAVEDGTY